MNRNQIYINGAPVTLAQKVIGAVVGIALLVGLFFVTAALLPFILIAIAAFIGIAWWRTRHIRAMFRQQQAMMNEAMKQAQSQQSQRFYEQGSTHQKGSECSRGETLEGDYKEL